MRILDEVIDLGGHGVALLCIEGDVRSGMRIRDALGHVHTVASVASQDGLLTLHIPQGEASYFERLMRNVRVDATHFEVEEG